MIKPIDSPKSWYESKDYQLKFLWCVPRVAVKIMPTIHTITVLVTSTMALVREFMTFAIVTLKELYEDIVMRSIKTPVNIKPF